MSQVTIIAAQSLDGYITRRDEPGTGFASPEDQRWFRQQLAEADWVVMGSGTYAVIRDKIQNAPQSGPRRFVVTRTPEKHQSDALPGRLEFMTFSDLRAALHSQTPGRVAVVGGAAINRLFIEHGLATQLWITLEPHLFGAGVPLSPIPSPIPLALVSCEQLAPHSLLLKYAIS